MTTALHFRQHEQFHKTAMYVAVAGPLAALLSAVIPGGATTTVAITAAAVAIAAMVSVVGLSSSRVISGGLVAALGGACLLAGSHMNTGIIGPILFALVVALPMTAGLRGRKLLISIAAGTGALLLARFAATQVINSSELSALPIWGSSALAGVAVSAASILAFVPRHVEIVRDPVATAHAALAGQVKGEIAELIERSNDLWTSTQDELEPDDTNLMILQDAVLRMMQSAKRWTDAEGSRGKPDSLALAERMESLDDRIKKSDDEVVINQYKQARAALAEQLKYLSGIRKNRERVLARMHNYLAAMERMCLAVANLKSTNASRDTVDLTPLVENLEELGQDIDSCSTALQEI